MAEIYYFYTNCFASFEKEHEFINPDGTIVLFKDFIPLFKAEAELRKFYQNVPNDNAKLAIIEWESTEEKAKKEIDFIKAHIIDLEHQREMVNGHPIMQLSLNEQIKIWQEKLKKLEAENG